MLRRVFEVLLELGFTARRVIMDIVSEVHTFDKQVFNAAIKILLMRQSQLIRCNLILTFLSDCKCSSARAKPPTEALTCLIFFDMVRARRQMTSGVRSRASVSEWVPWWGIWIYMTQVLVKWCLF
jgi:hypothetical protein